MEWVHVGGVRVEVEEGRRGGVGRVWWGWVGGPGQDMSGVAARGGEGEWVGQGLGGRGGGERAGSEQAQG